MLEQDFKNLIADMKYEIKKTQNKTMLEVNSNLIMLYFKLGKMIYDNSKYGNGFIKNVSAELKMEFPMMKGFSERNLRSMKLFYEEYKDDKIWQQLVAKLPWGHNIVLIEKIKDKKIRKIYAEQIIENSWSRNILIAQIDTKHHERIGNSTNNFNNSLLEIDNNLVNKIIKDPYIFDFISLNKGYKEHELENALIEKIKLVLLELGKGFSFVGSQYKISVGEVDYFADLLFYHLDLRCYIVVELKVQEFKPEFIGQLSFYTTAIDKILKKDYDNPTIGLLLCKDKDRLSVEWSLESVNSPIGVSSYEVKDILEKLPTEEDINLHIDIK